jgi:hypothetical protein
VMPGVTVEIDGVQKAMSVTDARGEAHFLSLAPGKYSVSAKISGFGDYKNADVSVAAGANVAIKATLTVGGVTATETVSGGAPLIDARKETVSTTISLDELQKIPSSRDPWVVLQTVPGVIVDRVNVGGADVSMATPGVALNFVLRSGTNQLKGSHGITGKVIRPRATTCRRRSPARFRPTTA